MDKLRLAGTVAESIVDGPGIRFVIFTQGCPHHCKGCQNPQTHDFSGGYDEQPESLIEQVERDPLITGVTLSGGEPFEQAEALLPLVRRLRQSGKHIMAYSGYTFEQLIGGSEKRPAWRELLKECDILVDGRFEEDKKSLLLKFRGSSNQRVIDLKPTFESGVITEKEF